MERPQKTCQEFVEWVVLNNGFPFTICESEEENRDTSESTADRKPES